MSKGKEPRMGRIETEVELTNPIDEENQRQGALKGQVRSTKVRALVDTGATMLVLPESVILQLGLPPIRKVRSRMGDGRLVDRTIYGSVKIKVMKRVAQVEALAGPPNVPALLGQVPLELLDLLVDSRSQKLILNPASPDPEMAMVDVL